MRSIDIAFSKHNNILFYLPKESGFNYNESVQMKVCIIKVKFNSAIRELLISKEIVPILFKLILFIHGIL